jgi:hypothetical protein
MGNVIELPAKSEVEQQLKDLLYDFQRGKIKAIAVACVLATDDEDTEYMVHTDSGPYTLLGAVEACKALVVRYIEDEFH